MEAQKQPLGLDVAVVERHGVVGLPWGPTRARGPGPNPARCSRRSAETKRRVASSFFFQRSLTVLVNQELCDLPPAGQVLK